MMYFRGYSKMKCYCTWSTLSALVVIFINLVSCIHDDFNEYIEPSSKGLETAGGTIYSNDESLKRLNDDVIKNNLVFHYYKNGIKTFEDKGLEGNLKSSGCLPTDKFAFILHGWRQDCEVEWMEQLREKLTSHRGGCIICVDYGFFKNDSYLRLLRYFQTITNIFTAKLNMMENEGLQASRAYIFGFSLGGQMATAIGRMFGPTLIKQIDTCDMAGPGFDFRKSINHREAAEQVNCWHTSRNKGTRFYTCHQNVRFGKCGYSQPAESPSLSSHSLCVSYYINAFEYPFYAGEQPNRCTSKNPAVFIPSNYTVGYTEDNKFVVSGEVFVPTSKQFPYNIPRDQVFKLNNISRNNSIAAEIPRRESFRALVKKAKNIFLNKF